MNVDDVDDVDGIACQKDVAKCTQVQKQVKRRHRELRCRQVGDL